MLQTLNSLHAWTLTLSETAHNNPLNKTSHTRVLHRPRPGIWQRGQNQMFHPGCFSALFCVLRIFCQVEKCTFENRKVFRQTPPARFHGRTLLAARSIPTYCALCRLVSPHRYCPLRSATVCSSCVPVDCPCCSPAPSAVPDGRMYPPLLASAMLSSSMFSSAVRRPAVKIVSLEQFAIEYSPSTTFCQCPTSTMFLTFDHRAYFCPRCAFPCCLRTLISYPSDASVPGTPSLHGPPLDPCPACLL